MHLAALTTIFFLSTIVLGSPVGGHPDPENTGVEIAPNVAPPPNIPITDATNAATVALNVPGKNETCMDWDGVLNTVTFVNETHKVIGPWETQDKQHITCSLSNSTITNLGSSVISFDFQAYTNQFPGYNKNHDAFTGFNKFEGYAQHCACKALLQWKPAKLMGQPVDSGDTFVDWTGNVPRSHNGDDNWGINCLKAQMGKFQAAAGWNDTMSAPVGP